MALKKPIRSHVQKGTVNDGYTTTSDQSESWRPRSAISRDIGMKSRVGGTRYVRKMAMPRCSPTRPVSRASAYPAGTASTSVMSTTSSPLRPRRPPRPASRLTVGLAATSRHLGTPGDPEEADRDRHQQREQEEGDRGALRQVAALDAGEEGEARQDLGRVVGPATRQDEDHDHVGEGEDEAEEAGHEHDRADQRHRDLEQVAPEPRPVHLGRVVDVVGDRG